ncbi:MAG: PEGA domain-containing protein [Patescibacteria group bacterium]
MTIVHRRILYIAFFIIFFISAPIVIMLAQGYKFNWNNKSWQKTGVLFLEVKPEKANIYLNNEFYGEKTSTRVKNLLPGKYAIRVEKENYIAWNKNLTIYPNTTTFAQYIRLFKNDPPTINILRDEIILISEQQKNLIALLAKHLDVYSIYILNIENQTIDKIIDLNTDPEKIFLSPQGKNILIQKKDDWTIVDTTTKKITALNNFLTLNISEPIFDSTNNNILYAISPRGIEKIDLIIPEVSLIQKGDIANFYLQNNKLFYVRKKDWNFELIATNLNSLQQEEIISSLPNSQKYKFYPAPDGLINIIDSQNQILYIFDPATKIFNDKKTIIPEVKYLNWHSNNSLLFINDYEIWTYQQQNNKYAKNLITRLSSKINSAIWFTYDTHLLYFTNSGLYITEVVSDDNNVVKYEKIKTEQNCYLTKNGEKIIWLTNNAIYESELQ